MCKRTVMIILLAAATALGVSTSYWTHDNQADFKKGTLHNVVATNLGDVKLSRALKTLLEEDSRVSAVYALAEGPDGTIYAATGPQGVLLQIKDDKVKTIAVLEGAENLSALLLDAQGRLLIGTCGEHGKILRLDHPEREGGKPVEIFSADGVQYVWAMQMTADGKLYAGTGPEGQLFEINPDGSKSVLYHSDENNLLSLLSDGKDLLYVGTDPNGLVYRVNRKTKDVFVMFNAAESEVSCLALDAKGNLYAGTGQAVENAESNEEGKAAPAHGPHGGRPEGTGGVPIPGQPPENPQPPAKPQPNPGEPAPIPGAGHGGEHGATGAPRVMTDWARGPVRLVMAPHGSGAQDDPADPGEPKPPEPAPGPESPIGKKGKAPTSAPANALPAVPAPEHKAVGNAIYRIDPQGFVKEIFRQDVTVYCMLVHDGVLLVGTGDAGLIYQIDPAGEETIELAKVEPKDVLAMLAAKDGRIILGLADVGGVAAMTAGYAADGTFTSPVLDATQVSLFGKIHLVGSLPGQTTLTVATRSGNVQDANKAGWSAWSAEMPARDYVQTPSPAARFLQYRLTLSSADGRQSPVVRGVDVAYQMPNLAPVVKSVKVGAAGGKAMGSGGAEPQGDADAPGPARAGEPGRMQQIEWEADDADGDALQYGVYYRLGSQGPWVLLKDKLTDTHYLWDTRTVADGRYQVKVEASNALANPPGEGLMASRVSDPLVVDNTPPVIGDLKATAGADGTVQIETRVVDRSTTVASCEYSVDSAVQWQTVLPVDRIFDSPQAVLRFTVGGLASGTHQITLRATDAKGNQSFETVLTTIPPK